jgi:hypothetical protein
MLLQRSDPGFGVECDWYRVDCRIRPIRISSAHATAGVTHDPSKMGILHR